MISAARHSLAGRRKGRTSFVGIMAALLAALGLIASATSAHAAIRPHSRNITFKVKLLRTPTGRLQPLGAHRGAVPADDEIVTNFCTTQVNNPHNSTHVPENVNVTGTTTCAPYPVTESYLTIELYYNGEIWAWGENYLADTNFNQTNAATACLNGTYYAVLDYNIYFGPTWTPPDASGELVSSTVSITC